jgi:hypothetical protein
VRLIGEWGMCVRATHYSRAAQPAPRCHRNLLPALKPALTRVPVQPACERARVLNTSCRARAE